jgi:large repetitive protein
MLLLPFPVGVTTVTWTVTDINSNTATATQLVTVTDDEDPSITAPAAVEVSNDAGECFATIANLGSPSTDDNCGVQSAVNDAPSTFPVGVTTVTWTVTDINSNTATATQLVTVTDDEDPSITAPAAVEVSNDAGECFATIADLGSPSTDDNCGVQSVVNDAPSTFPVGVTTVTWTVTDINSNTATATQLVTVTDDEDPSITAPAAVEVSNDAGECFATIADLGAPSTDDNCGVQSVVNDAPSTFPVGVTTVTWTVTDINSNTATATQLVTVTDDEDPSITAPAAVEVSNDAGECFATIANLGSPSTDDNCGVQSVVNDAPSTFPVGVTTVTWTVTDINSNTATATQLVTVTDDEDPSITAPAAVEVSNDAGECFATIADLGSPSTDDNCGVQSVVNDAPSTFPVGVTTVTWTVTDINSNTATATQLVTVTDDEDPSITAPAAVEVSNDAGECFATIADLGTPSTDDNCGVQSAVNDAPSTFPVGVTTVTWTVTDINSNTATATQLVTVTDDEDPSITAPAAVEVSNDAGECFATIADLGTPSTDDNCGVQSAVNDAPSTFPVGVTTVTWTVTDINSNTATATQLVTVTDDEDPSITAPAAVEVSNDAGECFATIADLGSPSTDDNCGVQSAVNDAPSTFPVGVTTVTWTVTDINSNTATATQLVTVTDDEDPSITAPAAVEVSNDAGECFATIADLGSPSTDDNCGVQSAVNDAPSTFPVGVTTVTWTVTDINSNTATATQLVTVTDDEDPSITAPAAVEVSNDAGECFATIADLGAPSTDDNCGVQSVVNDAPSTFPVGVTTVTWTVTDINSNTATATQLVTVTDDEDPSITAPAAVEVSNDAGECFATIADLGAPSTDDNCGVQSAVNDAPSTFPVGVTTVTWTVTDINSNTATATQLVTVTDDEDPSITAPAAVEVSNDAGECFATIADLGAPSTDDNCGVQSVVNDAPSTFPVGVTTVTWTVTDINSNTATATQLVTVTDDEDPSITAPAAVEVSNDAGECFATIADLGSPSTDDNCGVQSVVNDAPSTFPVGVTTVTWTVTDINSNTATATQLVTVTDDEDPSITAPAAVEVSNDAGECFATIADLGTPSTDDNCGVQSVVNDAPSTFPVGVTTVTWTVTDINSNTATATQLVTVTDDEDPSITAPAAVEVSNDAGECFATIADLGTPSTDDNCGVQSVVNDAPLHSLWALQPLHGPLQILTATRQLQHSWLPLPTMKTHPSLHRQLWRFQTMQVSALLQLPTWVPHQLTTTAECRA